jgi:hypothetical protein
MIQEQCYAWSRNIVKQLQKKLDKHDKDIFISDDEIECKISESLAFAYIYYYSKNNIPINGGREVILERGIIGESELRYLSLLNEIELVELLFPLIQSTFGSSDTQETKKIDKLLENLERTRELCKGIRGDLYIRNSLHLIKALLIEFNFNYRFSLDINLKDRRKQINIMQIKIENVFKDVRSYEHGMNEAADDLNKRVKKEVKIIKNENKRWFIKFSHNENDNLINLINNIDNSQLINHCNLQKIQNAVHQHEPAVIESIKKRWRI